LAPEAGEVRDGAAMRHKRCPVWRGQRLAHPLLVVGQADEDGPVSIRQGQRGVRRQPDGRQTSGEVGQVDAGQHDAVGPAVPADDRQGELDGGPLGHPADDDVPDGEATRPHGLLEVGPVGDRIGPGRGPERVAHDVPVRPGQPEEERAGHLVDDGAEIVRAGLRLPLADLRNLREDAEDLPGAADELAEFRGGAAGRAHGLGPDGLSPGGAQGVFVVTLDRERGHQRQTHKAHDPLRQ